MKKLVRKNAYLASLSSTYQKTTDIPTQGISRFSINIVTQGLGDCTLLEFSIGLKSDSGDLLFCMMDVVKSLGNSFPYFILSSVLMAGVGLSPIQDMVLLSTMNELLYWKVAFVPICNLMFTFQKPHKLLSMFRLPPIIVSPLMFDILLWRKKAGISVTHKPCDNPVTLR